MSILIVDDNLVGAIFLEIMLQEDGYTTTVARDGGEALDLLASTPEIALVLSDVMMPDMDGVELLARMREQWAWRGIPFIMLAARPHTETIEQALALGCRCFLLQPVNADLLLQRVHDILEDRALVLREPSFTMAQLHLDSASTDQMMRMLADEVEAAIASVEGHVRQGKFAGVLSELAALAESAELTGAERVTNVLDRLARGSESVPPEQLAAEYRLLLSELKTLYQALPPPDVAA